MPHKRIAASSATPVILMKEDPDGMLSPVPDPTPVGATGGSSPTGGLTNTELRAAPVPVSGTVVVAEPVTVDGSVAVSNLPATQPVSGTVAVSNLPATQPVSGTVAVSNQPTQPLTNTELRAAAVPVSGPLTDTQLRAAAVPVSGTVTVSNPTAGPPAVQPVNDNGGSLTVDGTVGIAGTVPVSGPLTDTQLRASAVPVAGTVAVSNLPATQPVSGTVAVSNMVAQGLTDAQLRAAAVPVSGTVNTTPTDTEQRPRCADLSVSLSPATGVGGTLTLPAPPAGQRHHITNIDITLYSTAARTGAAAPVAVSSTNLPSAQAWAFATAGAIGTVDRLVLNYPAPLRSVNAAAATTLVFPVVTGGLWRVNVTYYTAL